jgi:hypothetical protein
LFRPCECHSYSFTGIGDRNYPSGKTNSLSRIFFANKA